MLQAEFRRKKLRGLGGIELVVKSLVGWKFGKDEHSKE